MVREKEMKKDLNSDTYMMSEIGDLVLVLLHALHNVLAVRQRGLLLRQGLE